MAFGKKIHGQHKRPQLRKVSIRIYIPDEGRFVNSEDVAFEMKKEKMFIRSYSWGQANLSWSVVIEELLHAAEQLGNDVVFLSTNGFRGMKRWNADKSLEQEFFQRQFIRDNGKFDIDLTYTVPQNFPSRFLSTSKCKMAIYAYESSIMPEGWKKFYNIVDYVLPPSDYCADMIKRNGCPEEKIKVVPHGVDLSLFNPDVEPLDLKTEKKVKFLCVAEPHYRKQLDKLLKLYRETFTSDDDVCLVLKTKIFKTKEEVAGKKGFEQDLAPLLIDFKKDPKAPEIKVISKRLDNIAALYTACDAFALMTASEGWGVPYLEALATGLPVIAPRHGGQLQFLNDSNAILTKCGVRRARPQEQYWGGHPKAVVGNPDEKDFSDAMHTMYKEILHLKSTKDNPISDESEVSRSILEEKYKRMKISALDTASRLTWQNAMQQIIDIAREHNAAL